MEPALRAVLREDYGGVAPHRRAYALSEQARPRPARLYMVGFTSYMVTIIEIYSVKPPSAARGARDHKWVRVARRASGSSARPPAGTAT
jgi:hypothetical protein